MIDKARLNKDITDWSRRAKMLVTDFKGAKRRQVLRAGAQPLIKSARSFTPRSSRPHYRYPKSGERIKYNPGNLKRSVKVLKLNRSQDVFIGPKQGGTSAREIGGPGQPVDGYYAQMLFGSARAYRIRILEAARRASGAQALTRIAKKAQTELRKIAQKNRLR